MPNVQGSTLWRRRVRRLERHWPRVWCSTMIFFILQVSITMAYYKQCGILGFGMSQETTCDTKPNQTLYACDGVFGTSLFSSTVECYTNSYTKHTNTILWSDVGKDIDILTGLQVVGVNASQKNPSQMNGTLEECKTKCDSFDACRGFSFKPAINRCWLKSSNDLELTSTATGYNSHFK